MRTLSMAVKPLVLAVCGAVALYGCLGGGGGGGSAGTDPDPGVIVAGVETNSLIDKAPIRLICAKDGTVLGTGTTALGAYSVTIDPNKCKGQVLVEFDTSVTVPEAGYLMAGPDNVFETGDDEVYKPTERMPLKAMVDMTSAKVGDTVQANVSPITTAITNSALLKAIPGIDLNLDLATELKKTPTDNDAIAAEVVTATTNVANALKLSQPDADYTKIDPRTNAEMADKGGALAAAVFSATKAAGKTAQQIVSGIATNLNIAGNAAATAPVFDITKLSADADVTAAITAAKPLIDAEAKARKDMVDAMQLMGVTLPTTGAALKRLLTDKSADATVVAGTTTVANLAAVFEARQKESVVIAAAQKYMQDSVAPGVNAGVEMSKVVGAAVALVQKADSFVSFTANADAAKQVAAQQDVMKNIMAVVAANVATMDTVPTNISTPGAAAKVVASAQQIITAAVNANVVGDFATSAAVDGQPGTFDTATIGGVDAAGINDGLGSIETVPVFVTPDVKDSNDTIIELDNAKITDPGTIPETALATTTRSAVTVTDVIESDEITVANVNVQTPVKASGQGVSLVITHASGVKTVLEAGLGSPYETRVGYVIKGDKVKLLVKSPPVAQTPTRVSVTATLTLLGKLHATDTTATATRTASMTVQGPAGVVPGAPSITGITVSDGSATINFAAPSSEGSAAITEYTVTATPVGGGTPITVTGHGPSITITGLTNGTAYTFTVSATNGVGASAPSSQSARFTPATAPAAPTIGNATAGNGQATVNFAAPSSNGGADITGYRVTSTPGGITATGTATATSITVTGLTNGTAYTFKVTATNARGITSAESAFSNSVTPVGPAGAPTVVSAVAGNTVVDISFTAPANNGGATITGYTVTATGGGTTKTAIGAGTVSSIQVTGLTNGTTYTFVVTATNSVGVGATSASVTATPATIPGIPTSVSASGGDGQAVVSFTAPSNGGSAITGYTVTATPTSGTPVTAPGTAAGGPITVTGLTNGTAYTFTVVATNAKGPSAASSPSAPVTPAAKPGAPSGVTAVADNGSASVSFNAPTNLGGATILDYTVTSSGGQTATGSTSPITISGLTNGTSYTFTVKARTSAGLGVASAASSPVTPATVPGAPTGVTAVAGNGTATVSFAAPSSNGGSAITSYTATSNPGGLTGTSTIVSPITISGLTNGIAYTFTVVATNAKGFTASSASNSVMPAAPVTVFTATSGTLTDGQGLFKKLATSAETVTFSITVSGVGTTAKSFTAGGFSGLVTVNGATVDPEDPASALAKDGDVIQVKVKASTVSHKLAVASVNFLNAQAQAIAPTYWAGVCTGSLPNSFGTPPDIPAGSPFPSTCPAS